MKTNLLEQLKGIHYPPPPSYWWPLPPWVPLATLLTLLVITCCFIYKKHKNKIAYKKNFQEHLKTLKHKKNTSKEKIISVSILLRKAVIYQYGRKKTAHLTNEHWLNFLDETNNTNEFSQGIGRHLISGPYIKSFNKFDINALFQLIEQWSKKNL